MAEEARVMADLYETDPYAWSLDQAEALRALARGERRAGLDLPHLIEELDAMAGADRRAVESLAAHVPGAHKESCMEAPNSSLDLMSRALTTLDKIVG